MLLRRIRPQALPRVRTTGSVAAINAYNKQFGNPLIKQYLNSQKELKIAEEKRSAVAYPVKKNGSPSKQAINKNANVLHATSLRNKLKGTINANSQLQKSYANYIKWTNTTNDLDHTSLIKSYTEELLGKDELIAFLNRYLQGIEFLNLRALKSALCDKLRKTKNKFRYDSTNIGIWDNDTGSKDHILSIVRTAALVLNIIIKFLLHGIRITFDDLRQFLNIVTKIINTPSINIRTITQSQNNAIKPLDTIYEYSGIITLDADGDPMHIKSYSETVEEIIITRKQNPSASIVDSTVIDDATLRVLAVQNAEAEIKVFNALYDIQHTNNKISGTAKNLICGFINLLGIHICRVNPSHLNEKLLDKIISNDRNFKIVLSGNQPDYISSRIHGGQHGGTLTPFIVVLLRDTIIELGIKNAIVPPISPKVNDAASAVLANDTEMKHMNDATLDNYIYTEIGKQTENQIIPFAHSVIGELNASGTLNASKNTNIGTILHKLEQIHNEDYQLHGLGKNFLKKHFKNLANVTVKTNVNAKALAAAANFSKTGSISKKLLQNHFKGFANATAKAKATAKGVLKLGGRRTRRAKRII